MCQLGAAPAHIVVPIPPVENPQENFSQSGSDSVSRGGNFLQVEETAAGPANRVDPPVTGSDLAQDGTATSATPRSRMVRLSTANCFFLLRLLILVAQSALLSGLVVSWNHECSGDRSLFVWCLVTLSVAMGYIILKLLKPVWDILGHHAMAILRPCLFVVIYFFRIGWLFYGISPVFVQSVCTQRHRAWGISLWVLELLGQLPIHGLVCLVTLVLLVPGILRDVPNAEPKSTPQGICDQLPRQKYKSVQNYLEEQHALAVGRICAPASDQTPAATTPVLGSASDTGASSSWILAGNRAALLDEFVGVGIASSAAAAAAAAAATTSSSAAPSYNNSSGSGDATAKACCSARSTTLTPSVEQQRSSAPTRRLQSLRSSLSMRAGSGANVLTDLSQPAMVANPARNRAESVRSLAETPPVSHQVDFVSHPVKPGAAETSATTIADDEPAEGVANATQAVSVPSLTPTAVTCPICFCEYDPEDDVIQLPCDLRHTFHEACLLSWLAKSQQCPVCRSNIVELLQTTKVATGDDDAAGEPTESGGC